MTNQQKIEKAIRNGKKVFIKVYTENTKTRGTVTNAIVFNVPGVLSLTKYGIANINWDTLINDFGMNHEHETKHFTNTDCEINIYSI